MKYKQRIMQFFIVCVLAVSQMSYVWASEEIDDSAALLGVQTSRVLFDINIGQASKLELYLRVIRQTYDDLVKQGQKPEVVIAFRGSSVRLITTENWSFSDKDQGSLQNAAALLGEMRDFGVTIEACSIATKLFKIDNATLLADVNIVGNTFVSLIGYQAKGYALIPIQ